MSGSFHGVLSILSVAPQAFVAVDAALEAHPVKSLNALRKEVMRWCDEYQSHMTDADWEGIEELRERYDSALVLRVSRKKGKRSTSAGERSNLEGDRSNSECDRGKTSRVGSASVAVAIKS